MGDVQIEILKHMLEERYGLLAGFDTGNIVYKETILNTVEGVDILSHCAIMQRCICY